MFPFQLPSPRKALAALMSFGRAWLLRSRTEREMDREMRFHLDARAADLESRGMPRAEAERRARAEFGGMLRWKEAGREARGLRLVDDLTADVRYAARSMRRAPGFTAAAVLSLALGIGASTGIFSLMDLLLLRPLPVRTPQQLVHVTTAGDRGDAHSGSSNYPWFREVATRTDLFSDVMLVGHDVYKVTIGGMVEPLIGERVTANYYDLLGVPAFLGRTFAASDAAAAGGSPVAVISYALWQRRFGGDPGAIGGALTIDRRPYTIIGVTPPEFRGMLAGWAVDLTLPLDPRGNMNPGNWSTTPLIARLRPGIDASYAAAQLDPMLQRFVGATRVTERFRQRYLERISVVPAAQGVSDLRELFARPLRLLMAGVALLLLIACVNLAGLLVARNAARQHELGMRLALGAGRMRVVRQLLTESALLASAGAAGGLIIAMRGGNFLLQFVPEYYGPVSVSLVPDGRILGFALLATAATTLLVGVLPAWQASRVGVWSGVNRTTTRTATSGVPAGRTLVVAQCALSLLLVAGAVLLLRTVLNLSRVDTGFERDRVLVVQVDPEGTDYDGERLLAMQREMLAALATLSGVRHVTLSTSAPFNGNMNGRPLAVPGFAPREADDGVIQVNLVGPAYFDALGIPLLRGRPIDIRDGATAPPVAVVDESFARRYFGDPFAAVGERFVLGRGESAVVHEIVGVAADVRYQSLRTASERLVYVPWFQTRDIEAAPFEFVIRTEGDAADWINATRAQMQRLRPDVPVLAISTMTRMIDRRLLTERLLATLGTFFAMLAVTLAAVGVYGLVAYNVTRKVPEFGVRLALGAQPRWIMWTTLRETLLLAGIGSAIGVAGAVAELRLLDGLLFGLSPTDGSTLASAVLVLVTASVVAAFVPARRAASVDPLVALRCE